MGELNGRDGVCYANGGIVPFRLEKLYNGQDGSLFAPDLVRILCMGECVYENPFCGLRLSEEEIAMAQCMTYFLQKKDILQKKGRSTALLHKILRTRPMGQCELCDVVLNGGGYVAEFSSLHGRLVSDCTMLGADGRSCARRKTKNRCVKTCFSMAILFCSAQSHSRRKVFLSWERVLLPRQ